MTALYESHGACDKYEVDWVAMDKSPNMCWGMGASPSCKNCGRDENAHQFRKWMEELNDDE